MNVHLEYAQTQYADFAAVARLLVKLGVHHIRDGVATGQRDICRKDRQLATLGIRGTYVTQPALGSADLEAWAACVGPAIEAYEGPNEYDISHPATDENWVATIQSFQRRLYATVKGEDALARVAVLGPSFALPDSFGAVGDLSQYLDEGNMHNYTATFNPGTRGWGFGGYGSIEYNVRLARIVAGVRPIATTEIGYEADGLAAGLDGTTQAKYIPRMFLEQFNAGVTRTFVYELIDNGEAPYDAYGLVRRDLRVKPGFTALSSLLALLAGPGQVCGSSPLRLSIAPEAADVHYTLLEQGGVLYLTIWIEAPGYDAKRHQEIPVPTEYARLETSGRLCSAGLYRYDSGEHLRLTPLPIAADLRLPVTDSVEVLRLVPG